MSHDPQIITIFVSTLYDKNDKISKKKISKFDILLDLVTSSVMP